MPTLPNTLGAYWLLGLSWVSILSWYTFAAGFSIVWAFRLSTLLGACTVVIGMGQAIGELGRGREVVRRFVSAFAADTLSFLACLLVYLTLTISKIKHGSLPWVTIGNNDLLAYLKLGSYIRHFPHELQFVDGQNLRQFASDDVFGAFNLIALSSFTMRSGVENFAIPVMSFVIGGAGMAIARCCRRIFRLGVPLSILLAIVTLTCPLESYVTLNYFLGQMLFVAILLTTSLLMVEMSAVAAPSAGLTAIFGIVSSCTVMLCYPPWLLQYIIIVSGLMAVLGGWRSELSVPRWIAGLAIRSVIGGALISMALLAISFTRFSAAVTRLAVVSKTNNAGWPLSFVNLDLLFGWPDDWRMNDSSVSVIGQSLAVVVLVVLLFSMLLKFDRSPERFARSVLVATFAAAATAYLAIWFCFGASYQQWKFATTIPLGFGFVIPATAIFVLLVDTSRSIRVLLRCGVAAFLALIIFANVQQFYSRWSVSVYDFPVSLSNARLIDLEPGIDRGYVKMDDYLARMGASVFVVHKPVTFSGPTYWGDRSPPPNDSPFVQVEAVCNTGRTNGEIYSAQRVVDGTLPALPLGATVSFADDIDACLTLTGFSGREAFGRWTDGRHASIRFTCVCDLSRENAEVDIMAGAFLDSGTKAQTVFLRVNGSPEQRYDLVAPAPRHLIIKVPPGVDGRTVDVEIDIPDAASPAVPDSQDKRVLGLSVVSFNLHQGT